MLAGDEYARHEAAYKLMRNLDAIVRFCCRAVGTSGSKQFGAPLADPYAKPDMDWAPEVLTGNATDTRSFFVS